MAHRTPAGQCCRRGRFRAFACGLKRDSSNGGAPIQDRPSEPREPDRDFRARPREHRPSERATVRQKRSLLFRGFGFASQPRSPGAVWAQPPAERASSYARVAVSLGAGGPQAVLHTLGDAILLAPARSPSTRAGCDDRDGEASAHGRGARRHAHGAGKRVYCCPRRTLRGQRRSGGRAAASGAGWPLCLYASRAACEDRARAGDSW